MSCARLGSRNGIRFKDIQPVLSVAYYCDECTEFTISTKIDDDGVVTVGCCNASACHNIARKIEDAIDAGKRPQNTTREEINKRMEEMRMGN